MKHRATHVLIVLLLLLQGVLSPAPSSAPASQTVRPNVVRLTATAGIWLADTTPDERNSSAGQAPIFKLKSIQEMAAIRFDARSIEGREVRSARLFLHSAGAHTLRYVRVSTVNQDWIAGGSSRPYGPADGATYLWADARSGRAWSFPASEFADVVMGMGHSFTTYAELTTESGDWISVALTPELIYALVAGNTDGLAIMDGGTPALFNDFLHSAQAGPNAPYIDVEIGGPLTETPAAPRVRAEPAPDHAHATAGAIQVSIEPDASAFCWKLDVDGTPVPRWQVPHPLSVSGSGREQEHIRSGRSAGSESVRFYLDTLTPGVSHTLTVTAIARGGAVSPPTQLMVASSAVLHAPPQLEAFIEPRGASAPVRGGSRFTVWAAPGLIKVDPEQGGAMSKDMAPGLSANAVWDGREIQLIGARGEYVSYQLVIDRLDPARPLKDVKVTPGDLKGSGHSIGGGEIELFGNWYSKNGTGRWQPAYLVPWQRTRSIEIPDPQRGIENQRNQSVYVDIYVPKVAAPGIYSGTITVESGRDRATLPVRLRVYDFELPDTLSFLPELNSYSVPSGAIDFHRLAHQHRLVFNPWVVRPEIRGDSRDVRVQWDAYDAAAGPLLSGDAFKGNRRAGVPTPVMYLPFEDSWPTALGPGTYAYAGRWPGKGDSPQLLVDHYMKAPYIGDGLSQGYKVAFLSVQRQFVEHFAQKRWNRTEMQLFFGGKNTHRLNFGTNMWWTTDEPYHWDDWLALQFFTNLWSEGRRTTGADASIWSARADVSRPMWTGRVLDTIVDNVYWGGFTNDKAYRRAAWLSENTGSKNRAYGSVNPDSESNTQTVSALLQVWAHGANGFLPWQTLGNDASLDVNDNVDGNALMVPGSRFGAAVVGDMRLNALRDGEQIIEYLTILMNRYHLQREQVAALLAKVLPLSATTAPGASQDNASAGRYSTLQDWQIAGLRKALAELIVKSR